MLGGRMHVACWRTGVSYCKGRVPYMQTFTLVSKCGDQTLICQLCRERNEVVCCWREGGVSSKRHKLCKTWLKR